MINDVLTFTYLPGFTAKPHVKATALVVTERHRNRRSLFYLSSDAIIDSEVQGQGKKIDPLKADGANLTNHSR